MSDHVFAGLMLGLLGLTLVGIAALGARGRLRRNATAGIRTGATTSSPEAWAVAHRAGARPMAYAGACALAGGALVALLGGREVVGKALAGGTAVAVAGWVLVAGARGDRAARRLRD